MDILKIAIDWAKAELVSTSFFILCGIIFLSFPFAYSLRKIWQLRQDFEWLSCFFFTDGQRTRYFMGSQANIE